MTFRRGQKPAHDLSAAGRKGKLASPWWRESPLDPRTARLHEIRRAAERQKHRTTRGADSQAPNP